LPSLQGEQLRVLRWGANRDEEKTNGLPRGLLIPVDQPLGEGWKLELLDSYLYDQQNY
jgi:hypothetical protein